MAVNEKVNDHGRSYASVAIDQLEPELGRLVYALGRSNAQLFIGLTGVVGNLMLSVNQSLLDELITDISARLSRAIGEAAVVLGNSVEAFSQAYEEKLDRDRRGGTDPSAHEIY
jgi:hypothetical protein